MPVDEDLRARLVRLVPPTEEPAAVLAAVERRREQLTARRQRGRVLVAASVTVLVGVAALVIWSARDDDGHPPASGIGSITRVISTQVPPGMVLEWVSDWPSPEGGLVAEAVVDPGVRHYTVAYRDPSAPLDEQRGFELEVDVGVQVDLDELEADRLPGFGGERRTIERVAVGAQEGLAYWDSLTVGDAMHQVVWGLDDVTIRLDIRGFDRAEVLALAESVRVVPDDEWRAAIADADVGPPFEFLDQPVEVNSGERWVAEAGTYRPMLGTRGQCIEMRHRDAAPGDLGREVICDEWVLIHDDMGSDLEYIRTSQTSLVWGVVHDDVAVVQLGWGSRDPITVSPGDDGPIRGVDLAGSAWVLAGELPWDHYPDRVTLFDAGGDVVPGGEIRPRRELIPPLVPPPDGE